MDVVNQGQNIGKKSSQMSRRKVGINISNKKEIYIGEQGILLEFLKEAHQGWMAKFAV
jgi:hypothetical protein